MATKKRATKFKPDPKKPGSNKHISHVEDGFSRILETLNSNERETIAIVESLRIIAMQLEDINVAVAPVLGFDDALRDVIHHLEEIDAQTDEVAAVHRQPPSKK